MSPLVPIARRAAKLGRVIASMAVIASAFGLARVGDSALASEQAPVGAVAAQQRPAAATASVPTLQSIDLACRSQDYTAEMLRRFFEPGGTVVSVRERQEVDADGSPDPKFVMTFLGVVGEPSGSPLDQHWQQVYSRRADLLFRYGTFRIRAIARAKSNYVLYDFGTVQRANRAARRMVVFPNMTDKPICVIDVDQQTEVPLYFAEFDAQMQLLTELEAVSFTPTVQPLVGSSVSDQAPVTSFAQAKAMLGSPRGLIEPDPSAAAEYSLIRFDVAQDSLGNQSLTMTYTDGVDQFMIVQVPTTTDPFAALPSSAGGGHTIARFRDPAMRALFFWDDGMAFQVVGRGGLARLDEVARQIYLQALATH